MGWGQAIPQRAGDGGWWVPGGCPVPRTLQRSGGSAGAVLTQPSAAALCPVFQMSAVYAELENRLIGSFAGKMGNAALHRASPPAPELAHAAGTARLPAARERQVWGSQAMVDVETSPSV